MQLMKKECKYNCQEWKIPSLKNLVYISELMKFLPYIKCVRNLITDKLVNSDGEKIRRIFYEEELQKGIEWRRWGIVY